MATLGDIENKGLLALRAPATRTEAEVLDDLGLFGVHMAVIGLGVHTLASSPNTIGKNLMIFGAALGVAGYGVRWLS